ncbi:MAG: GGDEF domain-containing protein [Butyrivibrio sp.]|nr:GGDEF domain-containing protein [Butyrivibrio sp.]
MRKLFSFLGLALLTLIILVFISVHFFHFSPSDPVTRLNKGWTVTYHNQQYLNTNLESMSSQVGGFFSRGDVITLNQTQTLRDMHVSFPYLFFKTQFCAYEVYLDDQIVNTHYVAESMGNGFVGIGYNFVPLPLNYPGKRLSIKLYVTENSSRADIISPMVGNYDDLYRELIRTVLFPFSAGLFLILFGAVFLVISLLFSMRSSGMSTQILCSLLTITMGFWILTAYDVLDYIFPSPVTTTIEYGFLYLVTPLMYLILWDLHRRYNNRILIILACATVGFSLIFIVLHLTNIVHINHFQYPYYLISAVGLLVLGMYDYIDLHSKTRNSSRRILMIGLNFLALSLILYALAAISKRFVDYRQNIILNYTIPVGSMFFVVTQLLNYFVFMAHSFAQKKEFAALTKIAYVDNLTGLANRVRCNEKMLELDNSEDDYCILSLDLNGLKEVNDNSGHPAGDRLLKSFADTLSDVFKEKGFCARIGGDEFLVLLNSIAKEELDGMLKSLDEMLLKLDEIDQEINHSVSYGYAYRSETEERDTHSVFMLADKRMYDYKKAHYAHMMTR